MKKTLLVIVMAFIGSQSMAQIQAGSIFFTGFGSISTQSGETTVTPSNGNAVTSEHDKEFMGTFGLGGGYFLSDNIAVGAQFSVMGSKTTPSDTSDPEVKTSGIGFGVFARYYVPMNDNFYFFGQFSYSMMGTGSTMTQGGTEVEGPKSTTHAFGIQPGFTFFPTSKIGLDLTFGNLGWAGTTTTQESGGTTVESKSGGADIRFDMRSVTFGIQYFFGQ